MAVIAGNSFEQGWFVMGEVYLKKASGGAEAAATKATEIVAGMLAELDSGGEEKSREFAKTLDAWEGDIVVPESWFREAEARLPESTKDDLRYAHARVRDFALRQRDSQQEFEVELLDGLVAGQRLIPVSTAGCYVPGGRYALPLQPS